ncbi:hypothetical protein CES86_3258 [Brucella lupini]|uniref:Uncharacterized protein n=1 Tax=Brucella lupini TaxID=255457 RepID=A0A256GJ70_9HYPH|nr:hypothetical protein CES86_3258 [Brucella lupini]
MPLATALTSFRIGNVKHNCPLTGRAFADVAFHSSSFHFSAGGFMLSNM